MALVKSLLVASVAVSGFATAADAPTAPAKADPAKGATLYDAGDAQRAIPACASCHGAAGNSTMATNPKLGGQIEAYVYKQLVDFTTPNRANPVMTTFSKMLTDDEKRHIAAYLATTKATQGAAKNKDTFDLGRRIYRGGIAEKGVAACASCHGANANGIPAQYPRLAGHFQEYTVAQLEAFKAGTRNNSPQMTALAKRMTTEEMQAVADYVAGIK